MRITKQELKRVIQNTPIAIYNSPLGRKSSRANLHEKSQRSMSGNKTDASDPLKKSHSFKKLNSSVVLKRSLKKVSDISTRYDDDILVSPCLKDIIGQA